MRSKNNSNIGDVGLGRLQRRIFVPLAVPRKFCFAFVSLLLVMNAGLPTYMLRIKGAAVGGELAEIPVSQGDLLRVEYVHSIYKVKQSEIFSIGFDLRFYLEKVTFGSYAAAVYYDPDPPQGLVFQENLWVVKGDGKNYSVLKYRVGPDTGHVFSLRNQTVNLSGISKNSGTLIEIYLERKREN